MTGCDASSHELTAILHRCPGFFSRCTPRPLPPPAPCENNGKSSENDGSNPSLCSDKGGVRTHREETHAAKPCITEAQTAMSMEGAAKSCHEERGSKWRDSHQHPLKYQPPGPNQRKSSQSTRKGSRQILRCHKLRNQRLVLF